MQFHQLPKLLSEKLKTALHDPTLQTPFIFHSYELLKFNVDYFRSHIPVEKIIFPIKVNHDPNVLIEIAACGTSFEIASVNELKLLQDQKLLRDDLIFSTPVRIRSHTKTAFNAGVRIYAIDRISEVKKIAEDAPRSKVMIRLAVPNAGAEWKLDEKFGATASSALKLFKAAKEMELIPCGISFHVGWNNNNLNTWKKSMLNAVHVGQRSIKKGYNIEFINIGGGFPAHNTDQYAELKKISVAIIPLLDDARDKCGIQIWAEPGSFISANASVLVTKVIDVAKRNGKNWACADAGIFQGFYWKLGGLKYNVIALRDTNKEKKRWVVTGPTCDSQDVFTHSVQLPSDLKEGDLLLVFPAGAYINSARDYNGFGYPKDY